MIFNRIVLSGLICLLPLWSLSAPKENSAYLDIHHIWLNHSLKLTKNCVGFSAPVSARAFAYLTIGMYESSVEASESLRSLSGQLGGYERTIWADSSKVFNWPLVLNQVDFELIDYFYRNMPPSNKKTTNFLYDSIIKMNSGNFASEVNNHSIEYGRTLAHEIILWSTLDMGDNGFNENYPDNYRPPSCISCWTKTTPGYLPSLLPYWGNNNPLLTKSDSVVLNCKVIDFSTDSSSALYKDAEELIRVSKDSSPTYETIAEYWNDAPGYSGTPAGHIFNLAYQLVKREDLSLEKAMECYVKIGIALNEANIQAWKLKYTYNFIRPITYIHRYIDPQFNTTIPSPPFPEFPSGHSFQSGAGTEVLKHIFSDEISFIDSANIHRTDIEGAPRSYNSFTELSEEISISRYYGGIHFKQTLDISLKYGRKIGQLVSESIECRR